MSVRERREATGKAGWAAVLEGTAILETLTAWESDKEYHGEGSEQLIHTLFERVWERQVTVMARGW